MVRLINPEDWFLVFLILTAAISFPLIIAGISFIFKIPLKKVFNIEVLITLFQLIGILFLSLLLIQLSISSDGIGTNLIYGRF